MVKHICNYYIKKQPKNNKRENKKKIKEVLCVLYYPWHRCHLVTCPGGWQHCRVEWQ